MDHLTVSDEDRQSVFSDLSLLDNDTDEFGRKLLQHTKDAQRITSVLNSHGQAFRKARPNPRLALTLDNLERNDLANEGRSASDGALNHRAPSVASSIASDPPLNVPRQWGRKGRQNNSWLRRIHQDDAGDAGDARGSQGQDGMNNGHASSAGADLSSPGIDWSAAANQPLHSVEQDSSPLRSRHASTTPASARQQNASLDRIREWESDQDLTGASLLASTPALPSRNRRAIDEIRQREIHSVEERALTSSRRSMWERTPSETAQSRPPVPASDARPPSRRRSLVSNKENVPLALARQDRAAPVVLSKSTESIGLVDHAIQASVSRSPQRPSFSKRTDSMALLKRLARVSSNTPSPPSAKQPAETDVTAKTDGTEGTTAAAINDNEPQHPSRPEQQPQQEPLGQTTGMDRNELHAQTPVVTGAWVDTPRTARPASRASSNAPPKSAGLTHPPQSHPQHTLLRPRSEPNLPKSALDAILQDLRDGNHAHADNDPTLGDSTIASLEDMMNPNPSTQNEDPTVTLDIPDSILQSHMDNDELDTRPTTQADRDRRQEDLALEALNNRLSAADRTITDASRGLKNATRRVHDHDHTDLSILPSTPASKPSSSGGRTMGGGRVRSEPGRHHHCDGDGHCDVCGRHNSVFRTAWHEICSLYIRRDRRAKWGWRLTWIGLLCLLFWSWLATETTLCEIYCHPMYAHTMKGFGVDPDAPRFPYVIPTLLFRPLRPIWRPLFSVLGWGLSGLFSFMFTTDFAATSASRAPTSTVIASKGGVESGRSGFGSAFTSWSKGKSIESNDAAEKIVWAQQQGKVHRMNIWDQGQKAWEAPGEHERGEEEGVRVQYRDSVWNQHQEEEDEGGESESMLEDDYV